MESTFENVLWHPQKKKYKGAFKVGGKRYHAGYSHNPEELYYKTLKLKEQKQKEHLEYLLSIAEPGEEWKDIEEYEDKFLISNYGRVKSLSHVKSGIISDNKTKVSLILEKGVVNHYYIKDLVAKYFLGVKDKELKIGHKDKNPLNNRVDNLLINTKEELHNIKFEEMKLIAANYPGVYVDKQRLNYRGEIEYRGKVYKVGNINPQITLDKLKSLREELYKEEIDQANYLLLTENFKVVLGLEMIYKISDRGNLIKKYFQYWIPVKGSIDKNGYRVYSLGKNKPKQAHQLVAQAFLGHTFNGHNVVVDHIDHDVTNNSVENLQLVSNRENSSKKKVKRDLPIGVRKNKSGGFFAITQVEGKSKYIGTFTSVEEASDAYKLFISSM